MPLKLLSYVKHPQDRILLTEQIKWTSFYVRGILVVINPRKWFAKDSRHNVKSVQIRNLFWSIFSCIQSEYRKMLTKKNSVFGNLSHSAYFFMVKSCGSFAVLQKVISSLNFYPGNFPKFSTLSLNRRLVNDSLQQ